MSIRKEKAARLKIQILEHTLKLIGKKSFADLFVDEICARVKISKVTLFKYFPKKEDLLLYYHRIWCLARTVELHEKKKEGLQGIYFLFDRTSEELEQYPGMLLGLIGYLTDSRRPPKPYPVKREEKKLLYPNVQDVQALEILSVSQMLERFTLEAIMKKEITRSSSTADITHSLITMLYGSIVVSHTNQQPVRPFFRKNLDSVLRGLV
ncbi:MAG TPA: TetR/AcrR family transcriptional regulator [Cyclobacteriaceae bacterium]|jgi:AcrR family transcriptional regulator